MAASTSSLPISGPLSALAPIATEPGGVWAGGAGGVWAYASQTWQPMTAGQPVTALVAANDDSLMIAGTTAGVLISTNGGTVWTAPGPGPLSGVAITALALDPGNAQHVLAASASGIFASADGGNTWTAVGEGAVRVWSLAWSSTDVLAIGPKGLLVSVDNGASFAPPATPGIPAAAGAAACAWPGGGFMLLTAAPAGLWQVTANGAAATNEALPVGFSDDAGDVAIAASTSGLWVGGSSLWQNSGGLWTQFAEGGGGVRAILPETGGGAWIATSAGLWQMSSSGATAQPAAVLDNYALTSLAVSGTSATAALAPAGVAAGPLGATATWTIGAATAPAAESQTVNPNDSNEVAEIPVSGGVSLSLDGGMTWTPLNSGLPAAPVTSLQFDAGGVLWAATWGRGVWSITPTSVAKSAITLAALPASAVVGSPLTLAATVTVAGTPQAGANVTFSLSAGGTSLAPLAATANAQGVATVTTSLPDTAGTVAVVAAVGGTQTPADTMTATPGPAAAVTVVSGANQSQVNGNVLLQPIVLEVQDAYGNPIAGAALTLTGGINPISLTTAANGQAEATLTLPSVPGPATFTATVTGTAVSVSWGETALPTPGYTLQLGQPATTPGPNQMVAVSLAVIPSNGFSAAVSVQCLAPVPGCTIAPSSVVPGQVATVTFDSNDAGPSANTITVTVAGTAGTATASASETIPIESLTLTANTNTLSVGSGASPTPLTLTLASVNGLAGAIQLSVADPTDLPTNVTTLFTPQQVTLAANGQETASFSVALGGSSSFPSWIWLALTALLIASLRPRRKLCLLGALALGLAACGGSATAPPPPPADPPAPTVNVYDITLNATAANGIEASVAVTVTVTN